MFSFRSIDTKERELSILSFLYCILVEINIARGPNWYGQHPCIHQQRFCCGRLNEFIEWKFLNLSQNRKLADELRYETCFYIQSILRIVFCSKLLITNSTINGTAAQQIGNGHFSSLLFKEYFPRPHYGTRSATDHHQAEAIGSMFLSAKVQQY